MAPLPGVLRTHSLVTSIDCPAASDGDSPAHRLGADRPLRIPSLPCSPPAVLRRLGAPPPAMLIDRWGPGIGREQRQGPASDRLPPLFAPTPTIQLLSRRVKVRTRAKSRVSNVNVRSCECVVNLQQIDHENLIIGCMFSKPVTGSKTS